MTTKVQHRLRNAFARTTTRAMRKTFHERELKLFLREQKSRQDKRKETVYCAPAAAEAVTDFCV